MKDESIKDSTLKLKSIERNSIKKTIQFNNESELISNYIIDKLISLTISELFKKVVDEKISNYCYLDILDILNGIQNLEFIRHDKDDLIKKHSLLDQISKTPKHNKNKIKNDLAIDFDGHKLNNSNIIRGYILDKQLDPNTSFDDSLNIKQLFKKEDYGLNNKKNVMRILNRKNYKEIGRNYNIISENKYNNKTKNIDVDIEEHFKINNGEQIEKIEKLETIKIDNIPMSSKKNHNILITSNNKIPNNWNTMQQPNHSIIDRDASTKIKIENFIFTEYFLENNNNMPENNSKNDDKLNNNRKLVHIIAKNKTSYKYKYKHFNEIEQKESSPKKNKKLTQIIDLPSYNLEAEKSNRIQEDEDIKEMRKRVEMEINKRKNEESRENNKDEMKVKQKDFSKKIKKTFINRNITVDIKGKIVYIKPIELDSLIKEFKNMGSNSKDIGRIEKEHIKKNFKNVKVEFNNIDYFEQFNQNEKKRHNTSKTNNSKKDENNNKNINSKNNKNGAKFASGSNFEIMNPECGVNLIENKKRKTGGKDYYQKYGRCSFEIFQDQLNKTSSGLYRINDNNIINININDDKNNNAKNNNDIS